MSTSFTSSKDRSSRRGYRRPRTSTVPVEIDTAKPHQHSNNDEKTKQPPNRNLWEPTPPRIEILPGSLLVKPGEPWLHPPEPIQAAPKPTEIIQILLVGEQNAGKTSIAKRFSQMHIVHSVSNNSKTMTNRNTSTKQSQQWSVEYSKKDVTFWKSSDKVACARVQLWDVTTTSAPCNNLNLERKSEWIRLVGKMSAILVVVSVEHGPDALFAKICEWKQWLDKECCFSTTADSPPPIYLLIQKCDLLVSSQTIAPTIWMDFGSRITKLCDEIGISEWRLTTCAVEPSSDRQSPEQVIMEVVKDLVTTTVPLPQKQVSFREPSLPGKKLVK